jgi:Spy/CpxP family protein refolding chaperone
MAMVHRLDLTDAQRGQLRALMGEGRQSGNPGAAIREAEQKLHAAVLAETPDAAAIEALKTAVNAAHAAELDRRVAMMQKVAQILTPVQRSQLLQLHPQGPPRHH